MACTVTVNDRSGIAVAAASGVLTADEVCLAIDTMYADPNYRWRVLWDLRQADLSQINPNALMKIRQHFENNRSKDWPPGKSVILVDTDVGFGVGRVAEGWLADLPWQTRVVRDEEDAFAWLGDIGD